MTKEKLTMANKKQIEARERARKKKQTERMIQIIGGVVLVLIVLGIVWLVWSGGRSSEETPLEVPTFEAPTPEETSGPEQSVEQYNAEPPMTIDVSKEYLATFTMAKGGEFVVRLFDDQAPRTVNNFVFLARNGFYDGTTFHRVLDGFMAQGGDPTGTGTGGPGYQFEDEISPELTFDRAGLLAMANSGPNTNGSQFFITYVPTPHLNGLHTIFGEVIEGIEVVEGLTRRDPNQSPDFQGDAIETITVTEE
jgi:cyclophilin family peptidyl-prolyl cis-trans isomerase